MDRKESSDPTRKYPERGREMIETHTPKAFDQFRYRFTDSRRLPWTTVVSNESLEWLAEALQFPGGLA